MQCTIYSIGWPNNDEFFTNVPKFLDIKKMLEERYTNFIDVKKKYEKECDEINETITRLVIEQNATNHQFQHFCDDSEDEYFDDLECFCINDNINKKVNENYKKTTLEIDEHREKLEKLNIDYNKRAEIISNYNICREEYSAPNIRCTRNNKDWLVNTRGPIGPMGSPGPIYPLQKGYSSRRVVDNPGNIGDPTNFFMRVGIRTTLEKINNIKFRAYNDDCDYYNVLWNTVDNESAQYLTTEETKTIVEKPYFSEIFDLIKISNPDITREELLKYPYNKLFVDHIEYDNKTELKKCDDTLVTYYFNFRHDNIYETFDEILPEIDYLMGHSFVKNAI